MLTARSDAIVGRATPKNCVCGRNYVVGNRVRRPVVHRPFGDARRDDLEEGPLGDVHLGALSPALLADRRCDPAGDGTGRVGTSTDQIRRSRIRTSVTP